MQSQLPSDLAQAESMLEQHKRKKTEILQLINFTNEEGENIVTRVRQQVSKDFWKIQQFAVLCQCTEICRVLEDLLFLNQVTGCVFKNLILSKMRKDESSLSGIRT